MRSYRDPRPLFIVALLFTMLFAFRAEAQQVTARVGVGTIVCGAQGHAQSFNRATLTRNKRAMASSLDVGNCKIMQATYYMAVIADASSFTEPDMIVVAYHDKIYWTFKGWVECCFNQ